jgi:hypothetical protein
MTRISKFSVVLFSTLLLSSAAFAQTSGGVGGASGTPAAGSAGAGSAATSGVPAGPASPGGTGNVANDPSGQGNAAKLSTPPAPGTNSLRTAQSSGGAAISGTTTGSAASHPAPGGVDVSGPNTNGDAAISAEDKLLNKKIKSICRGC